MSILIAEDDPDIASLIELSLETLGSDLEIIPDGNAASERLRRGPLPDLVILDIMLPGKSGLELLDEISCRSESVGETCVIILSARADQLDVEDLHRRGASLVICKPFDVDDLERYVRERLDKRP